MEISEFAGGLLFAAVALVVMYLAVCRLQDLAVRSRRKFFLELIRRADDRCGIPHLRRKSIDTYLQTEARLLTSHLFASYDDPDSRIEPHGYNSYLLDFGMLTVGFVRSKMRGRTLVVDRIGLTVDATDPDLPLAVARTVVWLALVREARAIEVSLTDKECHRNLTAAFLDLGFGGDTQSSPFKLTLK